MLSNAHFYHRITRKLVVSFGTIFNNLKLYRYDKSGTTEIERINVPLSYATKEKFWQRITQDPNLTREVEMTLPRMSFELNSISYDPLRKTSSFIKQFAVNTVDGGVTSVTSAPYNFDFTLQVYVRNIEDGTQIIEQILPYFSPDYTISVNLVEGTDLNTDIPIVLNSVSYDMSNDTGQADELRVIIWTMTFSAKSYLFGPLPTNGDKLIRNVQANTYQSGYMGDTARQITMTTGTGSYKINELVYDGKSPQSANATAYVKSWEPTSKTLVVVEPRGAFMPAHNLKGAVSGADYTISTFAVSDYKLVNLTVVPNPLTANVGDDFGFTETIEEAPHIV